MANLAIVQATRYADGQTRNCVYLGSVQEDGWIYFNDDIWWRVSHDKSVVQLFYIDKQIWVSTNSLQLDTISNLNATQAQNVIHGAGTAAPDADIETAVLWAINKAAQGNVTYSQTYRNVKDPNAYSYDCSSFVITAMYVGGFDADFTGVSATTVYMRQAFLDLGFDWIPGSYFDASDLIRGDIQLNENPGNAGHTNIYIGNNQDVDCGGANLRIITHTPNDFGNGWHGILRYPSSN